MSEKEAFEQSQPGGGGYGQKGTGGRGEDRARGQGTQGLCGHSPSGQQTTGRGGGTGQTRERAMAVVQEGEEGPPPEGREGGGDKILDPS